MNVLSLFDGMSCGQIALERTGIKVDNYFSSEIKTHAIKVTQHNYPNTIQLGNIEDHYNWDLPKIDLIIAGSPCQDLSNAMKNRTGLDGEKSKLFFKFLECLKNINPKYFLLENVASMSKGNKDTISNLLRVEPIKINSSLLSAQLRNRLYWTNISIKYDLKDLNINLQDILTEGYTDRKKSRCLLESDSRPLKTPVKMFHRYYARGFTTLVFKDKYHYLNCKDHYELNFKNMTAKDINEFIEDLEIYNGIRYLNQIELERLQTINKNYTSVLDRNMASCLLGDGWTVDVICHILKNIK